MIEDIELRLARMKVTEAETTEGPVKKVAFVLKGYDKTKFVDWSLTLQAEDYMPSEYMDLIGKRIGDAVRVSLGRGNQQSELQPE